MTGPKRGQAGVGRLLAFVIVITVIVAVVPAALGLAGIDVRNESPGETAVGDLDDGALLVVSSFGSDINDDQTSVGVVELLVTPVGDTVDIADVTVTWDGATQHTLTPEQIDAGGGSFGVEMVRGEGSISPSDRALLTFDLGSDDIENIQQFGERLKPGQTVTVTVTTGTGAETTETMTVPESLPQGTAVRFV
ncbi:hypothetical protein ACFQJ7_16180 [Halovenus rubra]|uniref:Flagellin N-terminal-like domain-containing protein n=2 Tax=Halovenus rubra TaxID=869890 RepID=A0ABD5XD24_9EURY|nr:hypothetical protein [Halovenus rubra]